MNIVAPAACRLRAMGLPISPKPMKPMVRSSKVVMVVIPLFVFGQKGAGLCDGIL